MKTPKILAVVMAGGEGKRLYPLTSERSKPSVPFGGRYRIVDFVLSNLINSRINAIYMLVQYKSQSLIEHVRRAWSVPSTLPGQFITVVPPQMRAGSDWFQGTADAVYQNLNLIYQHRPDIVAVFGADHIYRMDVQQMVRFHLESEADVTVAALPVPRKEGSSFGIIAAEGDGRIREFLEKPKAPPPMPNDPNRSFASMGNYLFNCDTLISSLEAAHDRGENDFGHHILPRLLQSHRVFAYDFSTNVIPGTRDYEEQAYWRDVGTIEAYFDAHKDVMGLKPCFDVFNLHWPIYSSNYQGPVAKFIGGDVENSIIAGGTVINGAKVRNSVIRREVFLEEDVEIEDCIIMDYVRIKRGSRLRRTIVDRYNVLEADTRIGFDPEADAKLYTVSPTGIVVVKAGRPGLQGPFGSVPPLILDR